jgi:hypothetical protein
VRHSKISHPMTDTGHQRRFERASATSGLHPTPEVLLHCGEPTFRAIFGLMQRSKKLLSFDHLVGAPE